MRRFDWRICLVVVLMIVSIATIAQQTAGNKRAQEQRDYEAMLPQFTHGDHDREFLQKFALVAHALKHEDEAQKATKYYLDSLSESEHYTKPNLLFFARITRRLTDPGYDLFSKNQGRVDAVLGEGAAQGVVDSAITDTYITPIAFPDGKTSTEEPDWRSMLTIITSQCGPKAATCNVNRSATIWYYRKQRWSEMTKHLQIQVDECGMSTSWFEINNFGWDVFLHSNDKETLNDFLPLMKKALESHPNSPIVMDTYANLLYKSGKKVEAITWETKASRLAPTPNSVFDKTLTLMKAGQPTWQGGYRTDVPR